MALDNLMKAGYILLGAWCKAGIFPCRGPYVARGWPECSGQVVLSLARLLIRRSVGLSLIDDREQKWGLLLKRCRIYYRF